MILAVVSTRPTMLPRRGLVRPQDFHVAAVGNVQAGLVEAFVAYAANVCSAVALTDNDVVFLFQLVAHLFGKTLACDKAHFQKEVLAQVEALFLGLLGKVHEKARCAHVAGHAQLLHDVELGGSLAGTCGDD